MEKSKWEYISRDISRVRLTMSIIYDNYDDFREAEPILLDQAAEYGEIESIILEREVIE